MRVNVRGVRHCVSPILRAILASTTGLRGDALQTKAAVRNYVPVGKCYCVISRLEARLASRRGGAGSATPNPTYLKVTVRSNGHPKPDGRRDGLRRTRRRSGRDYRARKTCCAIRVLRHRVTAVRAGISGGRGCHAVWTTTRFPTRAGIVSVGRRVRQPCAPPIGLLDSQLSAARSKMTPLRLLQIQAFFGVAWRVSFQLR